VIWRHQITTVIRTTQVNSLAARGNERLARHPRGRATKTLSMLKMVQYDVVKSTSNYC
jgi:hypothetical protein